MHSEKLKSPLAVIFLTIFLDLVGFGILIPVIPQLLANPDSPYYVLPAGWTLATGFIFLGLLTSIFPLMQFIAAPILGQLSDKHGRRPVLIISLMGTCLSYVLFAIGIITRNIPLLFLSRALDGITGGNISVAQAAIADTTTPENRAKNFGLIGAAFGLGFIIGPYIGGKLSDPSVVPWFNAATPFWFAAILSLLNIISVYFLLPETLKQKNTEMIMRWDQSTRNIAKAFSARSLRLLFSVTFLLNAGFAFFTTFFSVFLIEQFHFTQGNIGDFFAYVGIWIAFTQAFLTRKVASKVEEYRVVRISLIMSGVAVFLYLIPKNWVAFLFIVPLFAISIGLTQANLLALISRSADPKVQGEVLGINASVQALSQAIPPILSGVIAAKMAPSTPIAIAAIIIVASGVLFTTMFRPKDHVFHS